MPNTVRNSLTSILPVTHAVQGFVTFTSGVPAVGSLSGSNAIDRDQVSVTDTATGKASIVIENFRGPQGICLGIGTPVDSGYFVATSVGTYSGNTATIVFAISATGTNVLTDTNFTFQIWAY